MDRLKTQPDNPQPEDFQLSNQTKGEIEAAAAEYKIDPVHFLGLLMSETSNLNPSAERWGIIVLTYVREAVSAYYDGKSGSAERLQEIINQAWPDISFGRSQSIVAYHPVFLATAPQERYTQQGLADFRASGGQDAAQGTANIRAVIAVRDWAFKNPFQDLRLAAQKFAGCIERSGADDPLGACVIYNAGSDRRGDSEWMADWGENVRRYAENLARAEAYRLRGADPSRAARALGGLWGLGNAMMGLSSEKGNEQHAYVLALKEEINALLPEEERIP